MYENLTKYSGPQLIVIVYNIYSIIKSLDKTTIVGNEIKHVLFHLLVNLYLQVYNILYSISHTIHHSTMNRNKNNHRFVLFLFQVHVLY